MGLIQTSNEGKSFNENVKKPIEPTREFPHREPLLNTFNAKAAFKSRPFELFNSPPKTTDGLLKSRKELGSDSLDPSKRSLHTATPQNNYLQKIEKPNWDDIGRFKPLEILKGDDKGKALPPILSNSKSLNTFNATFNPRIQKSSEFSSPDSMKRTDFCPQGSHKERGESGSKSRSKFPTSIFQSHIKSKIK